MSEYYFMFKETFEEHRDKWLTHKQIIELCKKKNPDLAYNKRSTTIALKHLMRQGIIEGKKENNRRWLYKHKDGG